MRSLTIHSTLLALFLFWLGTIGLTWLFMPLSGFFFLYAYMNEVNIADGNKDSGVDISMILSEIDKGELNE